MTKEQKERLTAWFLNLLVTYRIDFFRGFAISDVVTFVTTGDPDRIETAIESCREVSNLRFEPDQKDYTKLLRELRQIAKEVPLSDTSQTAITYIFSGDWWGAINALNKLRSECNEQNYPLNKIQMKYVVKNRLTDDICGEFETYGQAGKWVETYTHEQNEGLSPDAPEYCSPFDFELIEL